MIFRIIVKTILILLALPVAGLIIDYAGFRILGILGTTFHFITANFLTFPGVIHHELSHALMAFITGAKVREIVLFKPDFTNMSLGYVSYVPRGSRARQAIQESMTSAAPMIFGMITVSLLFGIIGSDPQIGGWIWLVWYLMISVLLHMTMSMSDLVNYFRGLWACAIVVVIFVAISELSGAMPK